MIRSKIAMGFLWALLALVLHVIPGAVGPAHAQGTRKDDIVFNSRGIPLAGATVRVCAMPASGQPCTPLALIYSDAALTQALANPTTTDGLGNYFFYAAPGKYEIEISGPGITTKQLPNVILPNDPASPNFSAVSAFSLNLGGNLTVNGNTTVVGNLASGTLNFTNQSTPPGAAGTGTVNLYTKTADKRLYYKDDAGVESGPLGAGAQTNVANNWTAQQNFGADTQFKGSNPWVDVRAYGVRAVNPSTTPAPVGLTTSITSGSTSATISSASTFQNGDGVIIYGAGAPQTMTTPATPTVTPSVARVGTGTGDVVNGPAGSTTYNYQIIARDKNGGLTAASAVGSTTTGAASLGSQSVAISSCTYSTNLVTCTTSAPHGLMTGAVRQMIFIQNATDTSINGWWSTSNVADTTHFTFDRGIDVRNGGATTSTGGTIFWFQCNHIIWTKVTGAFEYYIYGRTGASLTLIGVSHPASPVQTTFDSDSLFLDDFGATMMAQSTLGIPPYVPTTPPTVATSDMLITTIASGAGTTTLTLANAAGTTVSGATIRFDNTLNIITAAAAAGTVPIYFPFASGSYVINAPLDTTTLTYTPTFVIPGGLYLNEPFLANGVKIVGDIMPQTGTGPGQFLFGGLAGITANANPGVYFVKSNGAVSSNVSYGGGQLPVLVDSSGNFPLIQFDNKNYFGTIANSTDYMGIALLMRGATGQSIASVKFGKVVINTGPGQQGSGFAGTTATPAFYCNDCGSVTVDAVQMEDRGILFRPDSSGGFLKVSWGYTQGGITPFVTWTGGLSAGNTGGNLEITHLTDDTTTAPFITYLPSAGTSNPGAIAAYGDNVPSSGVSAVTGPTQNWSISASGQNVNTTGFNIGNALDGIFDPNGLGTQIHGTYGLSLTNGAVASGTNYPIFVNGVAPAQPTCSVSAGGSVPVGSYTFRVIPVWQNGGEGIPSIASTTCATTAGNQTITVNWTAVSGNPKGYNLLENGAYPFQAGCISPQFTSSTVSTTFTALSPCGNASFSTVPAGGPTMLMPGAQGMATPSINIGGGGVLGPPSAGFTATRTQTLPDVSGIIPVTSYVNSAYDNATRANGAIGSNWTVTNNGINISSNNFVGTTSTNDVAYWSANSFSNVQFSQVTITALNGTADFPGVAVLLSGSGASTQGYECVENTTNIYIQKISGTTNTTLTSAASSGAAGDMLRLEVAPGGALTCYKNGVSTLTTTDTSYTSGAPGLFLFGTVATSKNWSGGNLHPLTQLDSEQDWTKPQHFTQHLTVGATNPVPGSLAGSYFTEAVIHSGTETFTGAATGSGLGFINVIAQGAIGDGVTDNSTAFQSAFNAVTTGVNAGGRIFVPCGTFRIKSAYVQWPINTPIELFGAGPCSIIQKDSDSTAQSGSPTGVFYSPQVYGTSTTLSANANRGDQQLTVTSSTGFVAGGWIQINDNTGLTTGNCTTYQTWEPSILSCNLELQQIDTVPDGTHINLKTSLDNNYTTAGSATVKAITPVYAKVHDLKFSAAGPDCAIVNACGGRFFDLSMAIDSEFHNNIFDVPLAVAVQIHRGKHYKITDNVFRNGDNSQTQTGLLAIPFLADEASQYFTFSNNNVYKIGQTAINSQSNHGEITGNTYHGCGDDCINTHGQQVHDILIANNILGGWPASTASATVSGRCIIVSETDFNIQILNNTCSTFSSTGVQVQSSTQGNIFNVQVINNTVINPVTSTGTFPLNYLTSTAGGIIGISVIRVDNAKVNNNTIYGSFPTSSTGLNLLGLRQGEVIANHVIQTNTTGPPTGDTGILLEAVSLGNIAHVVLSQNTVTGWHNNNCQTQIAAGTLDTVTFANNSCFGGPGGNYSFASAMTNFIRDNNEGDTVAVQGPPGASVNLLGATSGTVTHIVPATVTSYTETDPNAAPTVANAVKQYTTGGVASFSASPGTLTIANGTATMTTAAITGPNCGTTVTVSATGVLTTDTIMATDNAAPAATTNGPLVIKAWPTANNVNFAYCVQSGTFTPAAATLNWRVTR